VRRILLGAVALSLTVGMLAFAPLTAAADAPFAGTWTSVDTDGSTQGLAIGRGSTPAVTYLDFYASSCASDGPSTQFVATGRGTIDDSMMWVDFRNGGCGRHKIGPFGLGFAYDAASDTLTDDFGISWHRFP
jgi:hypothetical protein